MKINKEIDINVAMLSEIGNTISAPVGFLLAVFGVIGTGTGLLPLCMVASSCITLIKLFHIKGLNDRKELLYYDTPTQNMYTALQKKEGGTAMALGATTIGAGVLNTHSAASVVSAAMSVGIVHPALSLVALGFAINALVELVDNICQWRERIKDTTYTKKENAVDLQKNQIAAARNLALSSFVKLLGWSCIIAGGFALAAPFTPWLIPGGLALVASSHLYNNFFAAPRVVSPYDPSFYKNALPPPGGYWENFVGSLQLNSCRGGKYGHHNENWRGSSSLALQLL
ncbi:MAG: hypothetical protein K0S27_1390 [Gammaproteobacteria bacterium]|jgi:hypothetical protein|nr:hypothetical protein [Gammaproteobacteria bacterium]